MKRTPRPRDPVQLGKLMVDVITGQVPDAVDDGKDAAASELGRKGGNRGGPGECVSIDLRRVEGRPDLAHVSTSYAERANLTLRMGSRRFTRLTNAFSKKVENHAHSVAIHTMQYHFVRIYQCLRCTPAMAANVTGQLWELADMAKVLEDWEA